VLAAEGWHKGVIGIVASRIAERHHRPTVLIALDPEELPTGGRGRGRRGTGSGRSIPGFDLLAGLDASAAYLTRHGGHRAAAGCEVLAEQVDAFRDAFEAHAAATLSAEDLVAVRRVDAVVAGDEIGLGLAEELERLAPFGIGNPGVTLLVPAARCSDPRTMGEGDKHVRFTVTSGAASARAVAFGTSTIDCENPLDATFTLELNEYNGSVEPRLLLRDARPSAPGPIALVGEPGPEPGAYLGAALAEMHRPLHEVALKPRDLSAPVRDRRAGGLAGTIAALVASGEPVLVVAADARARLRHLRPLLGGFALCSHDALERDPSLAAADAHVVMLDPPAGPLRTYGAMTHLTWGPPELRFALQIHEREYALRASLTATYRALRAAGAAAGEELETLLRGDVKTPRPAALAGRVLRVLAELHLVSLDPASRTVTVPSAERTALERSEAFRAYQQRYEDGRTFLSEVTAKAA